MIAHAAKSNRKAMQRLLRAILAAAQLELVLEIWCHGLNRIQHEYASFHGLRATQDSLTENFCRRVIGK